MALFQFRIRREPLRNLLVEIFNYIVLYEILFFEYYVNRAYAPSGKYEKSRLRARLVSRSPV